MAKEYNSDLGVDHWTAVKIILSGIKEHGKATYVLGIKINRDRARRLIGLSQSTHLDKILKEFKMDQSKNGFLPV